MEKQTEYLKQVASTSDFILRYYPVFTAYKYETPRTITASH